MYQKSDRVQDNSTQTPPSLMNAMWSFRLPVPRLALQKNSLGQAGDRLRMNQTDNLALTAPYSGDWFVDCRAMDYIYIAVHRSSVNHISVRMGKRSLYQRITQR